MQTQVMDSDLKLELRQMGHEDCGCEVRSVFAIMDFPAKAAAEAPRTMKADFWKSERSELLIF